jgi:hypothetical protein
MAMGAASLHPAKGHRQFAVDAMMQAAKRASNMTELHTAEQRLRRR